MNLAYVTLDEVHQDLAYRLAVRNRVNLRVFWPTETFSPRRFAAVLYDLDYLPAPDRDRILARLRGGPLKVVCGVHSYNVSAKQRRALQRNGVIVRRRLSAGLLRAVLERSAVAALPTA